MGQLTKHGERGQIVMLMPLFLLLFMLGATLTVDMGRLLVARRNVQAAVDFAALAAAQELPMSSADPQLSAKLGSAVDMGTHWLVVNGHDPSDPEVTAQINTQYEGDVSQIEVVASHSFSWTFGGFFGIADFDVTARAVAVNDAHPRDVVVILDRSGSMCADSHGLRLNCPPLQAGERWEPFDTMRDAAKGFTAAFSPVVDGVPFDHLALVSYSSEATLDVPLTTDFGAPGTAYDVGIDSIVPAGRTNMGHALLVARSELDANGGGAIQAIVLLTDGFANIYNEGADDDPSHRNCSGGGSGNCANADNYVLRQARAAAREGYALYTIGLTNNAGDAVLREVARIGREEGGGGEFFDVSDPSKLNEAFEEIARMIVLSLVE